MTMTDPIADLLTRIRNAHLVKHNRLDLPASKVKLEICRILKEQGYIEDYAPIEDDPVKRSMRVYLKYNDEGEPAIRTLRRVSRPGRRVYRGADELKPVLNGIGIGIVSTSTGLLTDSDARQGRVGGEILCEIW
ncbi:MAG: 30S ribosomal protein S8 [Acidobacteriota bacterium]|nr:30S ribosomal protein S8 [Acidobacteriota bacterium]